MDLILDAVFIFKGKAQINDSYFAIDRREQDRSRTTNLSFFFFPSLLPLTIKLITCMTNALRERNDSKKVYNQLPIGNRSNHGSEASMRITHCALHDDTTGFDLVHSHCGFPAFFLSFFFISLSLYSQPSRLKLNAID